MRDFVAACVQIAIEPNEVEANIAKGVTWLEKAAREYDAELVVFPETVTTGFVPALSAEELWDLVDKVPGVAYVPPGSRARCGLQLGRVVRA